MYSRKREAFQWLRINYKLFDNIHRICMPGEKYFAEQTNLSCLTVLRWTNDLLDSIKEILKETLKLDERTDISGTVQLVIFIRAVTADFDIVEEFLDMTSFSSTTTWQDICEQVLKAVEKFELNPAKLCDVSTDSVPSMTGKINGFTTKFSNCCLSTKRCC